MEISRKGIITQQKNRLQQPQELFNRIDLDCFSAAGLSQTEWEEVGDCFIKSGEMVVDEFISYNIKK